MTSIGLAKNTRLVAAIAAELQPVRGRYEATKPAVRSCVALRDPTHPSWSRPRRVVAKAEHRAQGANPRLVVTSL